MLFVPPSMPFMDPVPEAEAHDDCPNCHSNVPHAITDVAIPHQAGTLIEWDLNWNTGDYASGTLYQIDLYIDKNNYNGFTEKLGQYNEDASCISSCPSEIQLIKDGTWDYQLKIDTAGYAAGDHTIHVNAHKSPGLAVSGSSPFIILAAGDDDDTTPPEIGFSAAGYSDGIDHMNQQATNSTGYNVYFLVYAVDNLSMPNGNTNQNSDSSSWNGSCSPASGSLFPLGTTTVTCTATDAAGNVGTESFTVTVNYTDDDVVIPTVTASAYLNSTSTTGRTLLVNVGSWQSTDLPPYGYGGYGTMGLTQWVGYNIYNEDGQILQGLTYENGGCYDTGIEDFWGSNRIICWYFDPVHFRFGTQPNQYGMTAWQIEIPPSWEAGTYTIASIGPICGGYGTQSCADPADFGEYTTTVTIPALATADTTPPVISSSNLNLSTTNSDGFTPTVAGFNNPAAFPNLNGNPVTAVDAVTNSTGSYSQQLIPHCTSPDLAFDVTWKMKLNNTNFAEILGWRGPLTGGGGSGVTFPVGTTTLTCTATDYAGNVGTGTFTVTVVLEGTSLTITVPPDFTASATNATGQGYYYDYGKMLNSTPENYSGIVPYLDLCDGTQVLGEGIEFDRLPVCDSNGNRVLNQYGSSVATVCLPGHSTLLPIGINTITCTATDTSGNVGSASFTVTVNYTGDDAIIPAVTASAYLNATSSTGRTLNIDAGNWQTNWPDGTNRGVGYYIYDSGGNQTDWPRDSASGISFGFTTTVGGGHWSTWQAPIPTSMEAGTYTITSTTSECRQNHNCADPADVGDYTTTVTIPALASTADTTPPVITPPSNVIFYATNSTGVTFTNGFKLSIMDGLNESVSAFGCPPYTHPTNGLLTGTLIPVGISTITCTATDSAGNVGTGTFTVTVILEGAEEEIVIPSWIKNNAGWWADGQIDDRAFVSGLQWLISNGIMNIPPTEQGTGSDDVIPGWIKNNAGWWADNLIDDRNFVTGLQWLITNGIMIIG